LTEAKDLSCNTCGYALAQLAVTENAVQVWWCGRCGGVRLIDLRNPAREFVPALVERCRRLDAEVGETAAWHRVDIASCIYGGRQT
jgi:uncharacterized Zn finger protein